MVQKPLIIVLFLFLPLLISAQLSDQLIAKYTFNDGTANDETGSVHGIVNGATLTTDRWDNPNMAFHFSQDQFINLGDSFDDILTRQDSSFSWVFWFRADDLDNINTLPISKYGGAFCNENERSFFIRLNDNYEVDMLYYMTKHIEKYRSIQGHMALKDTCWHHVVVNYDPTTDVNDGLDRVEMYLDNVKQINSYFIPPLGTMGHIQNSNAMLSLGTPLSSSGDICFETFKGKIDDIRFYKKALSEQEVDSLYHELNPVTQDNWVDLPASFDMSDSIICEGTCVQLESTSPCQKQSIWTFTGADISTSALHNPTVCYDTPGQYPIHLLTDIGYAYDTITKYITVIPKPLLDLGNDTTICSNEPLILDPGIPNSEYNWSTGSTDSILSVTSTNAYFVTVTDEYCTQSDVILVDVFQTTEEGLGMDTVLCSMNGFQLDAPVISGSAYTWFDDSHGFFVPISDPGTYWIDIYQHNEYCVTRDSITVSLLDLTSFNLGNDTTICSTDSIVLSIAIPGVDILWSDGSLETSLVVQNAGTYWFTATLPSCSISDSITISTDPTPVIDLGMDSNLPSTDSLVLFGDCPGGSFVWSTGSNEDTILIQAPGTYWVAVTKGVCTSTDTIVIFPPIPPLDNFGLGNDTIICENPGLVLYTGVVADSYLWSDNSQNETMSVSSTGLYWVEIMLNGFTYRDSIQVEVSSLPIFDLGETISLCADSTFLTTGLSGYNYLWSTGDTTESIKIYDTSPYSVTVTNGACTTSDDIFVILDDLPSFDLGNDTSICEGTTLTLMLNIIEANYEWSTGEIFNQITVDSTGTYEVSVSRGACVASDEIMVTLVPFPVFDIGSDTSICSNNNITIGSQIQGDYLWSDNSIGNSLTITEEGTYSLSIDDEGCVATDSITITNLLPPEVLITGDSLLCAGDSWLIDIEQAQAENYEWQDGTTGPIYLIDSEGVYTYTISNACGTVSQSIEVETLPALSIDLGMDTNLPPMDSLVLFGDCPGGSFVWSTGSNADSILIHDPGIYWVAVTKGFCTTTDTIVIFSIPPHLDSFGLGNDTIICENPGLVLNPGVLADSYLWSDNSQNETISVSSTGLYWVEIMLNGFTYRDSIQVEVSSLPIFDLGEDITLCADSTLLTTALPGYNYLWSTGDTTESIIIYDTSPYSVAVTNGACTVSDEISVILDDLPNFDLGNDTSICEGTTLTLMLNIIGANYEWSAGEIFNQITVDSTGTYEVNVERGVCVASDEITVTLVPFPIFDLGSDTTICSNTSITVGTQTEGNYFWSDNSIEDSLTIAEEGTYSLSIDNEGCLTIDSITITNIFIPEAIITEDTLLCAGGSWLIDIEQAQAESYEWQDGSTDPTYLIDSEGLYTYTISNVCETISQSIEVGTLPALSIDLGKDSSICETDFLLIDAFHSAAEAYLWQDGSTSSFLEVNTDGIYQVTLSNSCESVTDQIEVTVIQDELRIPLDNHLSICGDSITTLDATTEGALWYEWQDGSTFPTLDITTASSYQVTVSNNCTTEIAMIEVGEKDCCNIYIPSAFSPNADGVNDVLEIFSNCEIQDFDFQVYNRFGGLVFRSTETDHFWDGRVKGEMAAATVYAYVLRYHDGKRANFLSGDISVMK